MGELRGGGAALRSSSLCLRTPARQARPRTCTIALSTDNWKGGILWATEEEAASLPPIQIRHARTHHPQFLTRETEWCVLRVLKRMPRDMFESGKIRLASVLFWATLLALIIVPRTPAFEFILEVVFEPTQVAKWKSSIQGSTKDLIILGFITVYFEFLRSSRQDTSAADVQNELKSVLASFKVETNQVVEDFVDTVRTESAELFDNEELLKRVAQSRVPGAPRPGDFAAIVLGPEGALPQTEASAFFRLEMGPADDMFTVRTRSRFLADHQFYTVALCRTQEAYSWLHHDCDSVHQVWNCKTQEALDATKTSIGQMTVRTHSRNEGGYETKNLERAKIADRKRIVGVPPAGIDEHDYFIYTTTLDRTNEPIEVSGVQHFPLVSKYFWWGVDCPTFVRDIEMDLSSFDPFKKGRPEVIPFMGQSISPQFDETGFTLRPQGWLLSGHGFVVLWTS